MSKKKIDSKYKWLPREFWREKYLKLQAIRFLDLIKTIRRKE